MWKLAGILCCTLAIGSLVVEISGDPTDTANDVILSRLDLARLSQLRVELRKLEPARRCSILEQELNGMFAGVLPSQGPHGLFGALASYLSQRQLPFQNNQPVLEDIQMCIGLAESSSPNVLPPSSQNQVPVLREVIRSPPLGQLPQGAPMNAIQNVANEFNAVKNRVKDVGQDLYNKVIPGQSYGHSEGGALHHEDQTYHGNMGRIGEAIKDIVEDAADGRIDGIKGHMAQYNPYEQHPQGSYSDAPHYDPNHEAYLEEQQYEADRRMEDQIEDAIEEDAAHHGEHSYGHQGGPYMNSAVDEMHRQHGVDEAKRVIEGQMNRLEHHLEDVVEDAADGRIDGIKGHMPAYNPEYAHHHGSHEDVNPNAPYYNPHEGSHHLHDQQHAHGQFGAGHPGPIDPRNLPSKRHMDQARGKVERRIDDLQDKLHNIVNNVPGASLRGLAHQQAGGPHYVSNPHGRGHPKVHNFGEKIKDTLDDIVEDAADGRIDGIKNRMGFPNSRHHYAQGARYPPHSHQSGGGSISRMLGKGLDKLNHKLKESNVHGHLPGGLARYEFADALRELHGMMSYNQHESPLMRCDRFSTLLSSSPMSIDQVRHIARQPLAKLATGRPLAESRPVLQSMLQEYGNLFMSHVDGQSRALGDELLRCASMAIQNDYHNQGPYHQGGYPMAGGYPTMGGPPLYAGAPHSGRKLRNKFNSKLGALPFEKQLNSRFPTMPAMPTMHY